MWVIVSQLPWDRPFHSQLHKKHCIIDGKPNKEAGTAAENKHSSAGHMQSSVLGLNRLPLCFQTRCVSQGDGWSSWKLLLQGEVFLSCAGWPAFPFSTTKLTGTGPATSGDPPSSFCQPATRLISPRERGKNHLGQSPLILLWHKEIDEPSGMDWAAKKHSSHGPAWTTDIFRERGEGQPGLCFLRFYFCPV